MRKLLILLFLIFVASSSSAQNIKLKGKIVSISKKQLTDSGTVTLSLDYPLHTFFILSDEKFVIDNMTNPIRYKLFAKDTMTINQEMVISYLSEFGDRLKLIAVSEISGNRNHIKLVIFKFMGSPYFTEYLLRLAEPKKRKNK